MPGSFARLFSADLILLGVGGSFHALPVTSLPFRMVLPTDAQIQLVLE